MTNLINSQSININNIDDTQNFFKGKASYNNITVAQALPKYSLNNALKENKQIRDEFKYTNYKSNEKKKIKLNFKMRLISTIGILLLKKLK